MTRLLAAAALALACSGPGSTDAADAGSGDGDGDELDLSRASWEIDAVDDRPANVSFDPAMAAFGDELVFAWVDLTPDVLAYQVYSAVGPQIAVEARSPVVTDATFHLTQISGGAASAHLAVAGGPRDTPEDIYYAAYTGGAWGELIDVSSAADPGDLEKTEPTALEVGDQIAIVFLARGADNADGVYAMRFSDPASPGPIETILDRARYDCTGLEASTAAGAIDLVAACSLDGAPRQLFYATDRSGAFNVQTVDLGASTLPIDPDIAVDERGGRHLVWAANIDCGGATCREIFYSRNLAPPIPVTNQPGDTGFQPRVAVDAAGRVIVVYHQQEVDATLHWTYTENGGGFVRSQLVIPPVAGVRHWLAGALEIDAAQIPHVVFVETLGGSPANTNILHGALRD